MTSSILSNLKNGWMLIRAIAVVSSSVTTIISTMLPIMLYYNVQTASMIYIFLLLIFGAFLIHGTLTHALNDHTDNKSGTDQNSPAILSGGSRVIQDGVISASALWTFGKWLMFGISITIIGLCLLGFYKIAILLGVGLWAAVSYSLPPFQFSYKPFIGEWLSTFPSVFALGIAGAWLTLETVPEWALQNAVINAIFCIAWVMVHHIPDRDADKNAIPTKRTSVVWSVEKFGLGFSRLPALLYFGLVMLCALWLGTERIWAAMGVFVITGIVIFLLLKMDVTNDEQVTTNEKIILLLAMANGIWLGIF